MEMPRFVAPPDPRDLDRGPTSSPIAKFTIVTLGKIPLAEPTLYPFSAPKFRDKESRLP